MTFDVAADAYDRFMGRYSVQLAPQLADLAGIEAGQRVLDVGCGPGALTGELVRRLGAEVVAAVDPSESFVAAAKARHPGVEVQRASAEELPFDDDTFDATLAQLVVHFMADAVAGLREMARVTRPGGVVAACVWDHAGDRTPLALFWRAAHELDPEKQDESALAGAREGHLAELLAEAGLTSMEAATLHASIEFAGFEDWWDPFTLGVGPAGAYVGALDDATRGRLRDRCSELVGSPPFTVSTAAWAARGLVDSQRVDVEFTSRLAASADIPALTAVMDAAIAELQRAFLDAAQIASSRAIMGIDTQLIDDGTYFVVESDGDIAGCGGWSRRATLYGGNQTPGRDSQLLDPTVDPARVRAMYTSPAYARRGVGRLILSLCEVAAATEGFTRLELMSTLSGEPLYTAYGFRPLERLADATGGAAVPIVRMEKPIDSSLLG